MSVISRLPVPVVITKGRVFRYLIRMTTQNPVRPDSEYGVSKAFGEAMARFYCGRWGNPEEDDPTTDARNLWIWLSHRDLVQLVW